MDFNEDLSECFQTLFLEVEVKPALITVFFLPQIGTTVVL